MQGLERTYSRERQRLGHELDEPTLPHTLARQVSQAERISAITPLRISEDDATPQFENEKEEKYDEVEAPSPSISSRERDPVPLQKKIIRFEDNDPAEPNNWRQRRKLYSIFVAICTVMNSTISSSSAGGPSKGMAAKFGVSSTEQLILPTSIYLVGYTFGPLIFGPLSESFGRKPAMVSAFAFYTIFSVATALAPNFAAIIVFRFLAGVAGACPIAVVGGICADVYHDPQSRGRAMAIFMASTTFGPILGPPVSGYIATLGWRWAFWILCILAGATWPVLLLMPETYAPVILKRRAVQLRKETGDDSIIAPIELEKTDLNHIITVVLTRPIRMICFEPLVLFTCLYLAYVYGVFYIFLQSYPIVFTGIYGFSAGEQGLTFLPIGIGALISAGFYLTWDSILRRAQQQGKPWSQKEEMRRLPLACIAGPFLVLSLFWAGWTAKRDIHWIVPTLSGIPFGMGYLCLFMAMLNYLVDAYDIFAASAMAASSFSRSLCGAVLPFATRPMYNKLGVAWACSLLGFLSLAMCVIPFVFINYGDRLREKSAFCQYLAQKRLEEAKAREEENGSSGNLVEDVEASK